MSERSKWHSAKVISITGGFAGAPSSIEGLDGTAVLAAEVIEISDVVIACATRRASCSAGRRSEPPDRWQERAENRSD